MYARSLVTLLPGVVHLMSFLYAYKKYVIFVCASILYQLFEPHNRIHDFNIISALIFLILYWNRYDLCCCTSLLLIYVFFFFVFFAVTCLLHSHSSICIPYKYSSGFLCVGHQRIICIAIQKPIFKFRFYIARFKLILNKIAR